MNARPAAFLELLAASTRTGLIPADLSVVRRLGIGVVLGQHLGDRSAHVSVLGDRHRQNAVYRGRHRLEGLLAPRLAVERLSNLP